ncbi:MAG: TetR/AcrR family transcriptional regulator [Pseudomonadota bacterium]
MTDKKSKKSYHHGNLRAELLVHTLSVVENEGPEAVSGRAAAKAVGVAPAAVYRHFPDKRALLTACAASAFDQLADAIEARKSDSQPQEMAQFRAEGEAYIAFALHRPNLFRLMFRGDVIDGEDEEFLRASGRLQTAPGNGMGDPGSPEGAVSILGWAVVHGLATLAIDSQLDRELPANLVERERVLTSMISHMGPVFRTLGVKD